jgi:hypothetical protein
MLKIRNRDRYFFMRIEAGLHYELRSRTAVLREGVEHPPPPW